MLNRTTHLLPAQTDMGLRYIVRGQPTCTQEVAPLTHSTGMTDARTVESRRLVSTDHPIPRTNQALRVAARRQSSIFERIKELGAGPNTAPREESRV